MTRAEILRARLQVTCRVTCPQSGRSCWRCHAALEDCLHGTLEVRGRAYVYCARCFDIVAPRIARGSR